MADLKVTFASTGSDLFDLALENLDRTAAHTDVRYGVGLPVYTTSDQQPETGLQLETTLTTAVLWSLFTDARVSEEELPEGWTDRRGWVGDDLEPDNQPWGSKALADHRYSRQGHRNPPPGCRALRERGAAVDGLPMVLPAGSKPPPGG